LPLHVFEPPMERMCYRMLFCGTVAGNRS
jgi:hypothetical protein